MAKQYEMASANNPEELIMAAQRSIISMLKNIIADTKKSLKQPGLTWSQLEFLLELAEKKRPEIIYQRDEF